MLLGFMKTFKLPGTHLQGRPTFFAEKIRLCLAPKIKGLQPKIHTIRVDRFNRWKAGRIIRMCYGLQSKHFERINTAPFSTQPMPGIGLCKSVQTIEIYDKSDMPSGLHMDEKCLWKINIIGIDFYKAFMVCVGGRWLTTKEIEQLAVNDGFENTHDFFTWFKDDFKGKIIHWTDFKY